MSSLHEFVQACFDAVLSFTLAKVGKKVEVSKALTMHLRFLQTIRTCKSRFMQNYC